MLSINKYLPITLFLVLASSVCLIAGDDGAVGGAAGGAIAPAPAGTNMMAEHSSTLAPTSAPPAMNEVASTTIVIESPIKPTPKPTPLPAVTVHELIRILTSEHADPSEPVHTFCDYLKPVCAALDKLNDKCITKASSQLRKFSKMSIDGKLNQCFLEAFKFDPTSTNATKHDITNICSSKNLPADNKGSYKTFQSCASKHWSPEIDKEIDKIQVARLEFLRANQNSKDSATGMLSQGDEEEAKIVSEVVDKVLGGETGKAAASSDVKVISIENDLGSKSTAAPAAAPATIVVHHGASAAPSSAPKVVVVTGATSTATPAKASAATDKPILSDPNTVVVFVDEAKTSAKPSAAPTAASRTGKPTGGSTVVKIVEEKTDSLTTDAPHAADGHTSAAPTSVTTLVIEDKSAKPSAKPTGTPGPAAHATSTGKPLDNLIKKALNRSTGAPAPSTSAKPSAAASSSTSAPTKPAETGSPSRVKPTAAAAAVVASSAAPSTSAAPATTTERPEERLEAKTLQLEARLKEERDMMLKLLKKNQDELESLSAMKALSAQRSAQAKVAAHDHSDDRVHQAEHHRQMSIDPVGHMIKHQQYELKKKLVSPAAASG